MAKQIDATAQARIWEYYQNQDPESFRWARPRLEHLVRMARTVLGSRPARVLTVGAGDGHLERRLVESGYEVTCVDLDPTSVQSLCDSGLDARRIDLSQLHWEEEPIDLVVASEVLEHLEPAVASTCVRNLAGALRTGGHLVVTVPCREKLERSLFCCPHCGEVSHRYGHVASFDASSLTELVESGGLRVRSVEERFFANYAALNSGGRLVTFAKHMAWKLVGRHTPGLKFLLIADKAD